jgi:adenylyltransferase/sulfurtransferase
VSLGSVPPSSNSSDEPSVLCRLHDSLNPHITIIPHTCPLLPSTALSLLAPYNLVLDCTDRPQTRYLVNDACVRLDVPLVSGAAIEWAGQWCVLGGYHQGGLPVPAAESQREDGNQKGVGRATWPALSIPTASSDQMSPPPTPTPRTRRPCYRCLFPQPLANTSGNDRSGTCEEEGVYGPIVGVVGVQMAAEAIKVVLGVDDPLPRLNLISMSPALTADPASTSTPFRSIRVRGPSGKCKACGEWPGVVVGDDLEAVGYDEFCGVRKTDDESKGEDKAEEKDGIPEGTITQASVERISVQSLKDGFYGGRIPGGYVTSLDPVSPGRPGRSEEGDGKKVLVDVREELEYGLCALPGSTSECEVVLGTDYDAIASDLTDR